MAIRCTQVTANGTTEYEVPKLPGESDTAALERKAAAHERLGFTVTRSGSGNRRIVRASKSYPATRWTQTKDRTFRIVT
jgi:hypothetical protein